MLMPMDRDEMRAGDSDREVVATQLRTALDEGRLDLHEYDERLQHTYSAKTFGDLQSLVTDLPATVPPQQSQVQPVFAKDPVPDPVTDPNRGLMPNWVGPYAGVVAVSVLIWAITSIASGELRYFWPIWMFIPLIFGVVGEMNQRRRGK